MNIQTDRAYVPADATVVRHLLIQITAPARRQHTERPPAEVAVVLDRSGSMGGRKIEMAKNAVQHAIQLLGPHDRLAIVTYDNDVETLLGATEAVPEAKALAMSRLRTIDARGGTDLHAGWARGAAELRASSAPTEVTRRVLLLSDGQANQGETDPAVLARYAAELRVSGITTTTFGLGADFDEQLMSSLAVEGGGHFYFIEHPAQIPDFFTSELGETLEVAARDVRLMVSTSDGHGVAMACLNGFACVTRTEAGVSGPMTTLEVSLGNMVADQQITVAIAVRIPASELGARRSVSVRVADRDQQLYPQPLEVEWRVVDAAQDAGQPVGKAVLAEAATLLADDARLRALAANRHQDFAKARAMLREAVEAIRALGPTIRRVAAIADALEAEIRDYEMRMDPLLAKQRHFASINAQHSRSTVGRARRQTS